MPGPTTADEPDGGTFAFMAPEQARIESPEDRESRPAQRRLRPGGRALLPADRPGPVPGPNLDAKPGTAPAVATSTREALNDRKVPRRLAADLPQGHGRRSGRPLPLGRGVAEGAGSLRRSSEDPGTGRRRGRIGPARRPGLRPGPAPTGRQRIAKPDRGDSPHVAGPGLTDRRVDRPGLVERRAAASAS